MSEPTNETAGENHMGTRLVVLVVPVTITARLLGLWLPEPIAWGGSMFLWMLVIYWLPSRASISFQKWLFIVGVSSVAAFFFAVAAPGWF